MKQSPKATNIEKSFTSKPYFITSIAFSQYLPLSPKNLHLQAAHSRTMRNSVEFNITRFIYISGKNKSERSTMKSNHRGLLIHVHDAYTCMFHYPPFI